MGVPEDCKTPSKECDIKVQEYCSKNQNDIVFCGCSTNALKSNPDPALGKTPIKCWADSCNKEPRAYQFYFLKDEPCPAVCIDQSTITALGSNISGSSFNQASCGGENVQKQDPKVQQSVTELYKYGAGVIVMFVLILLCLSLSMSSILFIK